MFDEISKLNSREQSYKISQTKKVTLSNFSYGRICDLQLQMWLRSPKPYIWNTPYNPLQVSL